MKKRMEQTVLVLTACTGLFGGIAFHEGGGIWLSLFITAAVTLYYFAVRLLIGEVYDRMLGNHADWRKRWFQPFSWEEGLYRRLRVKRWKDRMPVFAPSAFVLKKHSFSEVLGAMCQAELVHETAAVCSFLPLLLVRSAGAFPVFFLTSLAAALFDLSFAVMQRYNRPRVLRLMEGENRKR